MLSTGSHFTVMQPFSVGNVFCVIVVSLQSRFSVTVVETELITDSLKRSCYTN